MRATRRTVSLVLDHFRRRVLRCGGLTRGSGNQKLTLALTTLLCNYFLDARTRYRYRIPFSRDTCFALCYAK